MSVRLEANGGVAGQPARLAGSRAGWGIAAGAVLAAGAVSAILWWTIVVRPEAGRREAAVRVARGDGLRGEGRTADALREYRSAARLDPRSALVWYLVGSVEHEQDHARGTAALGKAARLEPRDPIYTRALGIALLESGRADLALPVLRRAVELGPDDELAHVGLARACLAGVGGPGDLERGFQELRTALRLQPGDVQARFRLARALFQAGRLPEARKEFEATLELLAEGAREQDGFLDGRTTSQATWLSLVKGCHYSLAQIAVRQGRVGNAREHWRTHAALDAYIKETYPLFGRVNAHPEDAKARQELAAAFRRHGLPAGGADGRTSARRWISGRHPAGASGP